MLGDAAGFDDDPSECAGETRSEQRWLSRQLDEESFLEEDLRIRRRCISALGILQCFHVEDKRPVGPRRDKVLGPTTAR